MDPIQATLEAAQIQKWGTIWGAIIGGIAIGVGVYFSWRTSLHLQKEARLAETRKNVYLELVENYSKMISGFQLLFVKLDVNWETQKKLVLDFSTSVDKAAFVCETSTKKQIYIFLEIFIEKFRNLQEKIIPLIHKKTEIDKLYTRFARSMELFDYAAKEYENIRLFGEGVEKIPKILEYFDEKLKESSGYKKSMDKITADIKNDSKEVSPLITELINETNVNANMVVHLLRKELGAKTDIALDKQLQAFMIIE
ncbi:hypothetical protein [Acinetobacter soli]|uniref:hypothetical protein n=1 Tax=Acinetobacter soli TaxID=487316 RepID=UPI001D190796|nr:hypothetical protein [Acinetobacter soli]MDS7693884.1 hypothetical protein [Acinetobacter soli]